MNRVVIFLGSHGHGSGAERVLEYLLAGAVDRREEICLLSPESSSVTVFARDLGYDWVPWISSDDAIGANLRALWPMIYPAGNRFRARLVHSWHTRHLEWAWAMARRWGVPGAGTLHDDPSPGHGQFGRVRKKIIRNAARHLDGVVAVSDAIAKRCVDLNWHREIITIRNGLPEASSAPRPDEGPLLRLGFMASGPLWKGIGLIPYLVRQTASLPIEWNLFGERSPETSDVIESLVKNSRVHYFGRVPLEQALPRIDVLLHLSLALDPYPTVLLEAARAGIPVIASCTGGTPEIVVDGHTGLLVEAGDHAQTTEAICRLVSEPKERRRMASAARHRFETCFRVEQMVADYFTFWNRLRASRP